MSKRPIGTNGIAIHCDKCRVTFLSHKSDGEKRTKCPCCSKPLESERRKTNGNAR